MSPLFWWSLGIPSAWEHWPNAPVFAPQLRTRRAANHAFPTRLSGDHDWLARRPHFSPRYRVPSSSFSRSSSIMPPLRRTPHTCRECHRTACELDLSPTKGELRDHERLCQGLDDNDKPLGLPSDCMIPGCSSKLSRPGAWVKHYTRIHQVKFSDDYTLNDLRLEYHPDILPDFDMNAGWGVFLSKQSPFLASPEIQSLYQESSNPWFFASKHSEVLAQFRASFEWVKNSGIPDRRPAKSLQKLLPCNSNVFSSTRQRYISSIVCPNHHLSGGKTHCGFHLGAVRVAASTSTIRYLSWAVRILLWSISESDVHANSQKAD